MTDENVDIKEKETPTDSATEEQTTQSESENANEGDTSSDDDEIMIPKSRFDQEVARRRELEDKLSNTDTDLSSARKVEGTDETSKKLQQLEDKLDLDRLFRDSPEAKKYARGMAEYVKKNPTASWDTAFKVASYDDVRKAAKQDGRKEAYDTIEKKQSVGAEGAQKKTSAKSLSPDMIMDRSVPLSEIEATIKGMT